MRCPFPRVRRRGAGILGVVLGGAVALFAARYVRADSWSPLGPPGVSTLSVTAAPGAILAGGGAPLCPSCAGQGIFRTQDAGATWSNVLPGTSIPPGRVTSLARDAVRPSILYAATELSVTGIWKSTDAGATWAPTSLGANVNMIRTAAGPPPFGTVWAATREGLYRSRDQGAQWTRVADGYAAVVAPAPSNPSVVYVSDFSLGASALFVSRDGGETWSPLPALGGLTAIGQTSVSYAAVDPADPNRIYAFSRQVFFGDPFARPGKLSRSADGGATWSDTGIGGSGPLLAPAPMLIYASSFPGIFEPAAGFFRSRDGGVTWVRVEQGLTDLLIGDLASDPGDVETIYASTPHGIFRLKSDPSDEASLAGGRFRARLVWRSAAGPETARPFPLTDNAAAFWFFGANNLEVVVKIVDGRALNGSYWIFVGDLTDLEYDLDVIDIATGREWTRHKAAGTLESFADTAPF